MSAVVSQDDTLFTANTGAILDLAARNRIPSAGRLALAEAGGLMDYLQNITEVHRRAAILVDRILQGAKPADLPIQEPTRFELVNHLTIAKDLGLTIPPAVLARSGEVSQ